MKEVTRERLEEIVSDPMINQGSEFAMMARMALTAMDSEPHTDDELSNLLWYSQEATCHSDPNYYCEFQRLATPGIIASIIRELQERRKAERDSEQYQVVPDAATAIRACMSEFPESVRDIVEECADIAENTCRAAMLNRK